MFECRYKRTLFSVLLILSSACFLSAGTANPVLLYTPAADVSRFDASAQKEGGQVRICWQTTAEFGISAFRVLRQRNGNVSEPVESGYVRAHGDEEGSAYELADPLVQAGDTVCYELLIVSVHGQEQKVAKWEGVVHTIAVPQQPPTALIMQTVSPQVLSMPDQTWIGSGARVRTWTDTLSADRVRLSLRNEGIYRVSAQELAEASGWDVADLTADIANTNLSLSCQGIPVAWRAIGDTLFFYGIPAASRFAPENVYWVAREAGTAMTSPITTPQTPATTNEWFVNCITHQGTDYLGRLSYSTLADAPAPYVASSRTLLSGYTTSYSEPLTDCAPGLWTGTVTVNLLSYYEVGTDDHLVRVSVGGTPVGESSWSGEQYNSFTYPFSSTNLTGATAALTVANIAPQPSTTDYTRFLCMSYVFSYQSLYRAQADTLRCTGGTGNTVAVSGFTTNDVVVLDVTATNTPVVIAPITMSYDGPTNHWVTAFPCGGSERIYQVFSKSAGTLQPAVRGVRDMDWSSPANAMDYAILIPPEVWRDGFRQTMQPLADYRNAQGLRTKIVDVEDIYNAFSYGLVDPLAIRSFCTATHPFGLKYLLLAAAGAIDFKHQALSVDDYTSCLIPTFIAGQRFSTGDGMTVALDGALGDIDGDGIPDVAVGRLPTAKTNDLAVAVGKTIAYENGLRWKEQGYIAADWDNTGIMYYPFNAGSDALLAPLSVNGRTVEKHYIDSSIAGADVRTQTLFPSLQAGTGVFHFFGHSNEISLGGGTIRLLYKSNITSANWTKPTIAVVIGCRPNRWHSLTTTICILPYGLFSANTGFVAGLGANGYMLGDEGEDLAVNLYTSEGMSGTRRLGDIWLRGMQRMGSSMPSERLLCFSLIGDPTLVFDTTPPSRGTVIGIQ